MRQPPEHVRAAIQSYDPDVDLRWDEERAIWMFTYQEQDLMPWYHRDGIPARGDTPVGEAISLLKEADNRNDGGLRLRAMRKRIDERKRKQREEDEALKNEATDEAFDRARVKLNGPRPFLAPTT